MKKFLLIVLVLPLLLCTGCDLSIHSEYPVHVDSVAANPNNTFNLICVDGVEYLLGYRKFAPHLRADEEGRPYLIKCENK